MRRTDSLRSAVSAAILLALCSADAAAGVLADRNGIRIEDGAAVATGARAVTGAAFMRITNESGADDRLVAVRTAAAARAEIHVDAMTGGVSTMRPMADGVPVPAGQTVVLERGGIHVMLMGLRPPLAEGATVPLTLVFERAGAIDVTVPLDLSAAAAAGRARGLKTPPAGN
jgi:periplasmic copper chaperone A